MFSGDKHPCRRLFNDKVWIGWVCDPVRAKPSRLRFHQWRKMFQSKHVVKTYTDHFSISNYVIVRFWNSPEKSTALLVGEQACSWIDPTQRLTSVQTQIEANTMWCTVWRPVHCCRIVDLNMNTGPMKQGINVIRIKSNLGRWKILHAPSLCLCYICIYI